MAIERTKVDSQRERRILTALVTSTEFLAQAAKPIEESKAALDAHEHFRVVSKWCLKHLAKYSKAPKRHIEDYFHRWSEQAEKTDKALTDSVRDLLGGLGDEYSRGSRTNVPFMVDELRAFLAEKRLVYLRDTIDHHVGRGGVEEAEAAVVAYRRVDIGTGAGIDVATDEDAWDRVFAKKKKSIVEFDGDAGRFFNYALLRGGLVGIQAPEKTGKTWWCEEFAVRALMQRRRVAMFEVGDLEEEEVLQRLAMRWASLPIWPDQVGKVKMPTEIVFDEAEECGYRTKARKLHCPRVLTKKDADKGRRAFFRAHGIRERQYLRVSTHPTGTLTVRELATILDGWDQEHSFVPDVIVIDYADILAPEDPKQQARDQVNDTWKALRRLSQQRHALVIVPTQASAMAYSEDPERLQTKRDFSNDKRKLAHCTAMLALNQTDEEAAMQAMRLNWIVLRGAPYRTKRALHVGNCLAVGRAMTCAAFRR